MDALISMFSQVQPQHWLALGFVLLIAEMLTGTTYLLWPAVAAGITGLIAFSPSVTWQMQWLLFAVLVIVLTLAGRPLRDRLYHVKHTGAVPLLNERAADLIGQRGAAAGPFVDGFGAVRINDSVWRAKSAEPIQGGVLVQVLSVDGVTLTVKPAA